MTPPEDLPLRHEIKRLRERLEATGERHAAEIAAIRRSLSELESKFTADTEQSQGLAAMQGTKFPTPKNDLVTSPPPLPKLQEIRAQKEEPAPSSPISPSPDPLPDRSFELDFAKVWFVRIGVVILLTGLVFLGNYAYQNWVREMPNGVRLVALFACALALMETGRRLAAKENLNRFGEVLLAGGMAFFYYCTFAAHHVDRLKVIDSVTFAAVLLFAAAGAIAAVSWLRQAKVTAALGFVLAAYATMLQPISWMSCFSNVLLGAMGLFFLLKPGWSGPGWASMLGSYGAFTGWQLLGASGRARIDDPAVLWFLPPLWAMFCVPGIAGQFRESLSERVRAWFTAINNAFFFVLFSAIWLLQGHNAEYWKVAAVFGPILIALGIIGRRQDTTTGGVNISQGLAVATFALVLKLEGHHLALTLAAESLVLAIAAWKYRGKSEAVFALIAAIAAAYLVGKNAMALPPVERIPVWSASLIAIFIGAASVISARIKVADETFAPFLRFSAVLLLLVPTLIVSDLCLHELGGISALLTAVLLAGMLSVASLKLDTKRLQPEIIWAGLWFLFLGVWLGFETDAVWPLGIATAISIAACGLWHRVTTEEIESRTNDLAYFPAIPAWLFSIAAPLFCWQMSFEILHESDFLFLSCQIAALLFLIAAIQLRCQRLAITSALLGFINLGLILYPGVPQTAHLFIAVVIALAAAATLHSPWAAPRIEGKSASMSGCIFRLTAFASYVVAWHAQSQHGWADWLALTAIALILFSVFTQRKLVLETLGLMAVALASLFFETVTSPWNLSADETSWRGIAVVLAPISLLLSYRHRPALIQDPANRAQAIRLLAGLSGFLITVWATQMLVWRFGWKPAAILWTMLGFIYVSAGLWQRLHITRVCGFILLILSLGKLFVSDVWDFTAFMRVVSFIVLGAALILLGLFYNKFAPAIKALLDDEKGASENGNT